MVVSGRALLGWHALVLLVLAFSVVAHAHAVNLRGVDPKNLKDYEGETFSCKSDGKVLPISRVNDDFCDCADGSDEPGTSACPNGQFYCRNKHHQPKLLFSSRVNDGLCDCCDGSDEFDGRTTCPNTCKEEGAGARLEKQQRVELLTKGLELKRAMLQEAEGVLQEKQRKAAALQQELYDLETQQKELQEKIVEAKTKKDEANALLKKYREEGYALEGEDEQPWEELKARRYRHNEDDDDDDESEHAEEKEKETEGEQPLAENEGGEQPPEEPPKPQLSEEQKQEVAQAKQNIADADKLINEERAMKHKVKEKTKEVEENALNADFGPGNVFLPLHGKPLSITTAQYTYTVTPFVDAKQGSTSLGKWSSWANTEGSSDDQNKYKTMIFENGDKCWGGPNRSLHLFLECGAENAVEDAQEPNKCEYTMRLKTPAACSEAELEALKQELADEDDGTEAEGEGRELNIKDIIM
ncbi:Glucosidase 2 subunit beta [Balamuthia mandrillaris]